MGDTPETVEAYTKQQLRWATGGFEIMLTHNPFSPKRKLTMDQRLQYSVTATLLPHRHRAAAADPRAAAADLLQPHPMNLTITPWTWLLYYAGFYVMQILLAVYTLGSFRWQVLLLAAVSFPIYVRALLNAFFGGTEVARHRHHQKSSAFNFIIPQVLTFVFLLGTSIVSIWRDLLQGQMNVATFWSVVNTFILAAFIVVGFREARDPQGVADPTDVDLASAVTDLDVPIALNRDDITKARATVEKLAAAELSEIPDDPSDLVAESTARGAAEPAAIN